MRLIRRLVRSTLRRKENSKMKKQWLAITITVATAITALFVLFWWVGDTASGISTPALAAPAEAEIPRQ